MKYADRKKMMDELNPEQLAGGKTPVQAADGYFRWHALMLLADIADSQASMAYAYRTMVEMQQSKAGVKRQASSAGGK